MRVRPRLAARGLVVLAAVLVASPLSGAIVPAGRTLLSAPGPRVDARPVVSAVAAPSLGAVASNVISPHPHRLVVHELAPQGALTEDPALAYDSVSAEAILNTYETLVSFNGTSTNSFVPVLATCVPGDAACGLDYNLSGVAGTNLVAPATSGPLAGEPVYFTFPIDPAARFYDPLTSGSWPVYPSDVMFSIARTLDYADVPHVGFTNGWMLAQALLPTGNSSYDSGLHAPYNSTPYHILSSMLVNNSSYCPAGALAQAGCITFVADGSGMDWPFLLGLLANGLGGSVTPCGVFTAHNLSVPGFTLAGAPTNGDGPCLLPGGSTGTSNATFQTFVASVPDTYWDSTQQAAPLLTAPVDFASTNLTGSGPYWAAVSLSKGYTLRANPAYVEPSGCSGALPYRYAGYCDPAPGQYLAQVNVSYDPNDSASLAGFETGTIDAGVVFPSDLHTVFNLPSRLRVQYQVAHTISELGFAFNLRWNLTQYQQYGYPIPSVPQDFFAGLAARQFFVQAFPSTYVQNTLLTSIGVPYAFHACGPIPFGMGDYYPSNVSCQVGPLPDTNPYDVGGAAWWWSQGTDPLSPYYDSELAACTPSSPCTFPVEELMGWSTLDSAEQLWISEVESLTSNAIQPYASLPSAFDAPLTLEYPIYVSGWGANYPDPSDPTSPFVLPGGLYPSQSSVASELNLTNTSTNRTLCGHAGGSPADLAYWAFNLTQYAPECQGIAYGAALEAANQARPLPDSPARVLLYNEMVQIVTKLGLYSWLEQDNTIDFLAPWINTASLNANPTIAGDGDQPFFYWAELPPNSVTFVAQKLPAGLTWGVTLGGRTVNNTTVVSGAAATGSLNFLVPNGSFGFNISTPGGYGVARISGPGGPNQTEGFVTGGVRVVYHVQFGTLERVTFYQNLTRAHGTLHMFAGAPWEVFVNASQAHGGDPVPHLVTGPAYNLSPLILPAGGRYSFQVAGYPSIYRASPTHGSFVVPLGGLLKLVAFHLLSAPVKFVESGLTSPFTWNITLVNASGPGAAWFAADCGGAGCVFSRTNASAVLARLPAGVYGWVAATDVAGKTATPASGVVTIVYPASSTQLVPIAWTG